MRRSAWCIVFLFVVVGFGSSRQVCAKAYQLHGSQKAGTVGSGPVIKGNTVELKRPARIIRTDCRADRYTIWQGGRAFVTGQKEHAIEGFLPPGRYNLKTSVGSVTIHLDDQAPPKPMRLWATQKKGPKHWIKRNTVILGRPYVIASYRYDGTDGGTISPITNDQIASSPYFRFISAHNKRQKGPAYFGPGGDKLKEWKGQVLQAGAYVCTPSLGSADQLVTLEVQLVPQ